MFDFHLHSSVSHDSVCPAERIVKKAEEMGLREICFTDHFDYYTGINQEYHFFDLKDYNNAYGGISSQKVKIRLGVEYGLTKQNSPKLAELLEKQRLDFVIGSVHSIESGNPYGEAFWQDKTAKQAEELYFQDMYDCVKIHKNFDVLGHLTFISKCPYNPAATPVQYRKYSDIFDEIFKELIQKGIGLEVNTSGVDSCGVFLPDREFFERFKALGGEIVTLGSDSHNEASVGQYFEEATEMLKDIFGYVCTFEDRRPLFHKL